MWSATTKKLGDRQTKYQLLWYSKPVAYREILQAWQDNFQFRCYFIELLVTSPFAAFRWETPPLTKNSGDRPFECVLINSPDLDREPDVQTLPIWLNTAGGGVAWLHIRLDHRPKYYRYLPYKKPL